MLCYLGEFALFLEGNNSLFFLRCEVMAVFLVILFVFLFPFLPLIFLFSFSFSCMSFHIVLFSFPLLISYFLVVLCIFFPFNSFSLIFTSLLILYFFACPRLLFYLKELFIRFVIFVFFLVSIFSYTPAFIITLIKGFVETGAGVKQVNTNTCGKG